MTKSLWLIPLLACTAVHAAPPASTLPESCRRPPRFASVPKTASVTAECGRVSSGFGSSSGSAVAVARGFVSFALGTDTAGSGRVPAGFNNIVGLKPTRGMLSARGVVPACRSLDCVSVFAGSVSDGAAVLDVAAAFDAEAVRGKLVLCGITKEIREVFEITKLDRVIRMYETLADALEGL